MPSNVIPRVGTQGPLWGISWAALIDSKADGVLQILRLSWTYGPLIQLSRAC